MTSAAPQNPIRQLFEKAAAQRSNGQWSQAVETYSQIIKLAPMFVPAYVERGLLVHEIGDPGKAFHDFENAIKLDAQYGPAYYGRGWVKHTRGDFDGEMQDAKKGLLLDRQNAGMYYRRIGAAHQGLDQYQEAIEAYNDAIEFYEGKDEGTIYNRGLCYMEINDYASAQADFNKCLELDPDWAWAFAARAKTWLAMDDCEKAIADCDQAITFQPNYVYSYLWRAIAYETLGDKKKARKDFEVVLKNTNSEQLKSIAKQHIQELKGAGACLEIGASRVLFRTHTHGALRGRSRLRLRVHRKRCAMLLCQARCLPLREGGSGLTHFARRTSATGSNAVRFSRALGDAAPIPVNVYAWLANF